MTMPLDRRSVLTALAAWAAAPAGAAIDEPALARAVEAADLHSLLVWQRGELRVQHYRRSLDKPSGDWFAREVQFGPDVLHDMRSITKSVVGLLVGQAVGRGQLAVDRPVLDFYPELADLRGGPAGAVTLAHLLHMSCGLQWNETVTTYGTAANDETPLYWKTEPARYLLDRAQVAEPGTLWNYNGGCTAVLGDVLLRATGRNVRELATADLFGPLGITQLAWRTNLHGLPLAYAGLRLTPPDLLKIGQLMLAGGQWGGRSAGQPVLPAAWVAATLEPRITIGAGPLRYGHQWWAGTVDSAGHSTRWSAGFGNGGQRLFVVPERELVVVMTAGQYNKPALAGPLLRLFRQIVLTV